jgi:hypothetical protein
MCHTYVPMSPTRTLPYSSQLTRILSVSHLSWNFSRPNTVNPEVLCSWASKKKIYPYGMSILSIILRLASGCHSWHGPQYTIGCLDATLTRWRAISAWTSIVEQPWHKTQRRATSSCSERAAQRWWCLALAWTLIRNWLSRRRRWPNGKQHRLGPQ